MATVSKWTPFGVALDITATAGTVTRTSATKYTVTFNVSWKTYWSGAQTNYGMSASSGDATKIISAFNGTKRSSGSASFTAGYSISGNGAATKTVSVTFKNFNTDNGDSATKAISLSVNVPAWTSYTVKYNATGGTPTPGNQTKWKDQNLTLSNVKPTRTGYSFQGWATSSGGSVAYAAGATYTTNAAVTLYAVWKINTYTVKYNANGGTGSLPTQTKTYGTTLKLTSTIPTRTNYKFLGWATSASATIATYTAGANYEANASVTLYAVWELEYVPPKIYNLQASRCDSSGNIADDGTCAKIQFDWETTYDQGASINISCKPVPNGFAEFGTEVSGKSGSFSKLFKDCVFSTETSYTFNVTVYEDWGESETTVTMGGYVFPIDFKAGGKGAAFGKPAELENVLDIAFQTKLTGGLLYPILEPCDLDEIRIPNIYAGRNVSSYGYWCGDNDLPFSEGTFILEILSAGPNGQILQRITICDKKYPQVFERWFYTNAWGEWTGGWIYPTIGSEFAVYASDGVGSRPCCRKDGRLVEVRGIVKPTVDIAGGTDMHNIITVPDGYRPNSPVYVVCQGSGNCVWLLRVNTDGTVALSRYRNGDTTITASAGAWLPFQVTYFAK